MPLEAWSSAVAALAYSAFSLRLLQLGYAKPGRMRSQGVLLLAVLLSAIWAWAALALALQHSVALEWLVALADVGRYAAWLAFLLHWLQSDRAQAPVGMAWIRWVAPSAAALVMLALATQLLGGLHAGPSGEPLLLALWGHLALPVLALVLLEQVFRNVREDARWSIKPLCLGLLGLFLFDLYTDAEAVLFHRPDTDALAIRGMVHAAVVPLLAVSVLRRNDWVARVRLSPKAAFHSASLLAVALYLLFLSGVGYYVRYFGGDWGRALAQGLVFVGLLLLLLLLFSGAARAKLRVMLGKHLFHYRFDYREEWLRFTRTLSDREPAPDVGQRIVRGLADMLESPSGALWSQSRDGSSLRQTAQWNVAPSLLSEDLHAPLCRFLTERGWVINLAELRSNPERYGELVLPQWLQDRPQAWLVLGLMVDQMLIGFCVLDQSRAPLEVDWEVQDLLRTASQQAASYLAQAQATEALLEARKFEAFNRMSAFVAHDLKNIITQQALMLKNAKRLSDNPAFQQDMLLTIENSLERMHKLLQQLRQEPAPRDVGNCVDLVPMLQRIADQSGRTRKQRMELQCSEPLPVRGQGERLERVLGHLVHNALDATESGGRVWARLERCGPLARVQIGDTGPGMSASFVQSRLFKPFQSTKPTGMGIGAFESLQYVQELGGTIEVESTEGQGTLITVQLPLVEPTEQSGLAAAH